MRILHICQRDDVDIGGSLRVAEALVREQRRSGIDAWLLFLYGQPSTVSKSLAEKIVHLRLESSHQAIKGVFLFRRAVGRIDPQILHMHDGLTWPRLALLFGRPLVVTHAHLSAEWWGKKPVARRLLLRTTDSVVGVSRATCESWESIGFPLSMVHCVGNGVDFDRFGVADWSVKHAMRRQRRLYCNKKVLLWVGRLQREMKGTDRIERFVPLLPSDVDLVVVGNGPEFLGMQERCAEHIQQGTLKMVGSSPTPQDYYKMADAFLFTSHYEPFGLVLLEAVASGLTIISYPVERGGASELLARFNAGMVEDGASKKDVARVLVDAFSISKDGMARRLDAQSEYGWPSVSKRIKGIYNVLLESSCMRLK